MAGSFSNYLELEILDHITGKGSYTAPTAYVALATGTINETTFTECTGTGYARQSTAAGDWNAAATGSISNANDISWSVGGADWGTLTGFGLYDSSSGGNQLVWGDLTASRTPSNGDTLKFTGGTPGDLVINLD